MLLLFLLLLFFVVVVFWRGGCFFGVFFLSFAVFQVGKTNIFEIEKFFQDYDQSDKQFGTRSGPTFCRA